MAQYHLCNAMWWGFLFVFFIRIHLLTCDRLVSVSSISSVFVTKMLLLRILLVICKCIILFF